MSVSEQSNSFYCLHDDIQRWIWQQGWSALRDIQEAAIKPVLGKETDLIISASTAGGKTEAAFLPIFSNAKEVNQQGLHTLGIIPLKALINDQYRRLSYLGGNAGVKVTPWHGDISQSIKTKLLKNPKGVLLITPESLEALLINKSSYAKKLLSNLSFIVIDELHAFIGTERGKQLQSLMSRIDHINKSKSVRIGLSATLGDMELAYQFMRPNSNMNHKIIKSCGYRHDLKLQIRGYLDKIETSLNENSENNIVFNDISDYLFDKLRGTTNLVFANSRIAVEKYSCSLREKSESENFPNEFYPHHGSLSKELRQWLETRMHKGNLPTTTICTNTLELGIDIGSVDSVAQIGAPPSVSSLRQRLGRSGRQIDAASVLRVFCIEGQIDKNSSLSDLLRLNLFFVVAVVELLLEGWYEPPEIEKLHLSTLVQQIIALIAQYGGLIPKSIWQLLCQSGAFSNIETGLFQKILLQLGEKKVIQQDHDGTVVLGPLGEKLVNNYKFYAAFNTPVEYIFQYNGKTIASSPLLLPLKKDERIILAGRRWKVLSTNIDHKIVTILPARGGNADFLGNSGFTVSDEVARKIRQLYSDKNIIRYLDKQASELYIEGLDYFDTTSLTDSNFFVFKSNVYICPWLGSKVCQTLLTELNYIYEVNTLPGKPFIYIKCKITLQELYNVLTKIIQNPPVNPLKLAAKIECKEAEKFDNLLNNEILSQEYAVRWFDTERAHKFWNKLYQQISLKLKM